MGKVLLLSQPPSGLDVITWSDNEIKVHIPPELKSGTVRVETNFPFGLRASPSRDFIVQSAGLPSLPNGYQVPVEADSPWPTFRRDLHNSGRSAIPAVYHHDQPWTFQTAKGIFNTPVIDNKGIIYIGSADHFFYAINPNGSLNWKYETGEIIDSAAAIGQFDSQKGYAPITFISGDGYMYHFKTGDGIANAADRLLWKYEAELRPGISFNRWFEGNVAIGQDGTLFAGNTNFNYYAIHPDGSLKWVYSTTSNNWSQAAFGDDGSIYWGSVDTYIRGVSPSGNELWKDRTLGFVAASAAVGSDNTVYIGSFDSQFYAIDPLTGQKTGFFFDQRPNRDRVAALAGGGRMLDVFCHIGAFGLRCAAAGATDVTLVDASAPALEHATRAAEANGFASRVATKRGDAFDVMTELAQAGEKYDVVVCDPPAFAKSKKDQAAGLRAYGRLARLTAPLVTPGGFLFIASCSHHASLDLFAAAVSEGLYRGRREGRIVATGFAGPDHPVHPQLPESAYLKGQLIQLF